MLVAGVRPPFSLIRVNIFIDFVYVATTFLFSNDKVISEIQKIHGKKLQNFVF